MLNLSESAARLSVLVTKCVRASISTSEQSVQVGSDQGVDGSAGHLLHLLHWLKQVDLLVGLDLMTTWTHSK